MSKVVVVTGAGKRRVGFHVAEAFARRGWSVAAHYRSSAAEAADTVAHLRGFGAEADAFPAELGDEGQVIALAEAVFGRFGRVDAVVNTAAVWPRKRLEDVTAADVRACFDTNTLGTFLVCQRFGLRMCGQPDGGCLVTVGDWADARPYRDYAAYFPSKAAIPGLTRTFAVELGHRNPRVRVNAVLPGPVMLPPDLPEAERQEAINATLVKREGSPDHIAAAVLALVENEFVTGVCLPVDGGRTVYAGGL
jgi:pteridine reductase